MKFAACGIHFHRMMKELVEEEKANSAEVVNSATVVVVPVEPGDPHYVCGCGKNAAWYVRPAQVKDLRRY